MASLSSSSLLVVVVPTKLGLGFQSSNLKPSIPRNPICAKVASSARFAFRFENVGRPQLKGKLPAVVFANSTKGDKVEAKHDVSEADAAAKGPPLLTILAGFVVFLFVGWAVGSVVLWLVSLVVNFK